MEWAKRDWRRFGSFSQNRRSSSESARANVTQSPLDSEKAMIQAARIDNQHAQVTIALRGINVPADLFVPENNPLRHPYPAWVDRVPFPQGYEIPHFDRYPWDVQEDIWYSSWPDAAPPSEANPCCWGSSHYPSGKMHWIGISITLPDPYQAGTCLLSLGTLYIYYFSLRSLGFSFSRCSVTRLRPN